MYFEMILPVNLSKHAAKRQGKWEGEGGSCAELILPSGEIPMTEHSSKPIMVVPQPNILCTDHCQAWRYERATK